jgi:predicted HicB family RNase H-like nuclease
MNKTSNTLIAGRPSARSTAKAANLASLADTPQMKRINFDVTAEVHRKLKVYAAEQGRSIKELLSEYVSEIVK